MSSFEEVSRNENSYTIHMRNIQALGIELNKVSNGISPKIIPLVFPLEDNTRYPYENKFKTRNVRTVKYGTDTLAHLGPNIWSIIPSDMKKKQTLKLFAKRIKQ